VLRCFVLRCLLALAALWTALTSALAQEPVRIGLGYGFAFLPLYLCEDLKLVEKQARAAHLDVVAQFQRFANSGELHGALAAGQIDMAPFGTAPLLAGALQAKDARHQIVAVSGITSLPLTLLTNQANERSIADLKASDRIAVPTNSITGAIRSSSCRIRKPLRRSPTIPVKPPHIFRRRRLRKLRCAPPMYTRYSAHPMS
jgi:ABC-type nitrate/sulfonate/bicarbonate transport system substrate-binding protein